MGDATRRRSSTTSLLFAVRTPSKPVSRCSSSGWSTVQWGQPNGSVRVFRPIQRSGAVSGTSRFNALADLLLGYPSSYSVQTTPFSPHLSYTQFGSYIQDDWRLTPSVTANFGLRWEYFGRPVERDDRIASFDLATGQQVFPGQNGYPRSLVDADYKNFAPRLGLAWRASDRMTLRTGYGIFYTPDVINTYRQLAFQAALRRASAASRRVQPIRKTRCRCSPWTIP